MKSNVIGTYKEIQIHGPVEFSKDIERLYISKDELKMGDAKGLLEQVKSFCSNHSLDYELFENETIERLVKHFELIIKSVLKDPNENIEMQSFITPEENQKLLDKLGKFKMGKACIYFKQLDDLDLDILEKLCHATIKFLNENYKCACRT